MNTDLVLLIGFIGAALGLLLITHGLLYAVAWMFWYFDLLEE